MGVAAIKKANVSSNTANKKVLRNAKVCIIGEQQIKKTVQPGKSQAVTQDPFEELCSRGDVIEPPFDMLTLAMLPEHSSEMEQCIETMEVNIEGFGHRFIPRVKGKDGEAIPDNLNTAVESERVKLINFFQYCTSESFIEFRGKLRKDLETTGNAYFEVVRDLSGKIQSFTHLPSYQCRLAKIDDDSIMIDRKVLELQIDGSVKIKTIKQWKRFRKFVQSRGVSTLRTSTIGFKTRWFKEFGDPRIYSNKTGEETDGGLHVDDRATEVIHLKLYSSRTPYGLPRFIGNLLSIFGDRAAEEINYVTFRNNNIPSMVVCVSNGQLTEGSIERIESFVESQIQGSDNYSKFLILEAEGEEEGEDSGGHIKIDIKPLVSEQHKDALFQNYSKNNHDKIRQVWRLPPIFVGKTEDYTRATAEASRVLADEQIFSPERARFDELFNRILFPEMEIIYHKYKSNSPNTTDNAQLVKILSSAEKTGGITPKIARLVLGDILSAELPDFPEDFPADIPFSLTMAEAVKNMADATEPGQQVTALKRIETHSLVDDLYDIHKELEDKFQSEIEKSRND